MKINVFVFFFMELNIKISILREKKVRRYILFYLLLNELINFVC